jgi:hypothetical protein
MQEKRKILDFKPILTTAGLPRSVQLKLTARYMLTLNIAVADGLVNGATGKLMHISKDSKYQPVTLWLKFDDAFVGKEKRAASKQLMTVLKLNNEWTPIEQTSREVYRYKSNKKEVERMKTTAPLKFSIIFPNCENGLAIIFHNVESLSPHVPDIEADSIYMNSDILCFVETRSLPHETLHLRGHKCFLRQDCILTKKPGEGTAIFVKDGMNASITSIGHWKRNLGGNVEVTAFALHGIGFYVAYKSPRATDKDLMLFLDDVMTNGPEDKVLMGDLNIDLRKPLPTCFKHFIGRHNLKSINPNSYPTTDAGTHIDVCLSNIKNIRSNVYESYFSFHKPLCIFIEELK